MRPFKYIEYQFQIVDTNVIKFSLYKMFIL